VNTYFKNQLDLSKSLNKVIDDYWKFKVDEEFLEGYISEIAKNNETLLFYKDGGYTSIVKNRVGIKRLRLVSKILHKLDEGGEKIDT